MFRISIVLTLVAVTALRAGTGIAETADQQTSPAAQTPEETCVTIRAALSDLAQAERAQALALDLVAAPGNSTATIEARLTTLLDRTSQLRRELREVRRRPGSRDPRTEQCTRMGYRALTEAEKLSSNVEELLRSRDTEPLSTGGAITSDAAPVRSGGQP